MNISKLLFAAISVLLIAGCTSIDYFGEHYPPTTSIDLYFSKDDIKKPYEVMGKAIEQSDDFVSEAKMQEKLKEKGCEVGADAILIESFGRIKVGENTNMSDLGSGEIREKRHHSRHHSSKKETFVTTNFSQENTNYVTEKQIKASFLKYKK
jgi:hypothetical protein